MTDDQEGITGFDRFVAELQQQIKEQEQALYSAKVIEEVQDPRNLMVQGQPVTNYTDGSVTEALWRVWKRVRERLSAD